MRNYLVDTDIRKTITKSIDKVSLFLTIAIAVIARSFGLELIPLNIGESSVFTVSSKIFTVWAAIRVILMFIYSKILWKLTIVQAYHKVPNLNGIWEGQFISSFLDENGKNKVGECKMIIKQDWDKIQCVSYFNKSKSYSVNVALNINSFKGVEISFDYYNEGNQIDEALHSHLGYNVLTLSQDKDMLEGTYFTDKNRCNHGSLNLRRVSKNRASQSVLNV